MPWEPDRYEQFKEERFAPFNDLVSLINVRPGLRVIDLGCGTGELTARLSDLLLDSDVLGIDSSAEMLERAREHTRPGLRFEIGRVEGLRGEWDIVFSHAVIQWVEDHPRLVPQLLSLAAPGGQLAVQLPSNFRHPTHLLYAETAGEEPFRTALGGWTRIWPTLSIQEYADLLYASGAEEITVFEKVYPHVLADADALADWRRWSPSGSGCPRSSTRRSSSVTARSCARATRPRRCSSAFAARSSPPRAPADHSSGQRASAATPIARNTNSRPEAPAGTAKTADASIVSPAPMLLVSGPSSGTSRGYDVPEPSSTATCAGPKSRIASLAVLRSDVSTTTQTYPGGAGPAVASVAVIETLRAVTCRSPSVTVSPSDANRGAGSWTS